jgi:hypothetical protein
MLGAVQSTFSHNLSAGLKQTKEDKEKIIKSDHARPQVHWSDRQLIRCVDGDF